MSGLEQSMGYVNGLFIVKAISACIPQHQSQQACPGGSQEDDELSANISEAPGSIDRQYQTKVVSTCSAGGHIR